MIQKIEEENNRILKKIWENLFSPKAKRSLYYNYLNTAYIAIIASAGVTALINWVLNLIEISKINDELTQQILKEQNTILIIIVILAGFILYFMIKKFKEDNKIPQKLKKVYRYWLLDEIKEKPIDYIYSEIEKEFGNSPVIKTIENKLKVYSIDKEVSGWEENLGTGTIGIIHNETKEKVSIIISGDITIEYPITDVGYATLGKIDNFLKELVKDKRILSKISVFIDEDKDI